MSRIDDIIAFGNQQKVNAYKKQLDLETRISKNIETIKSFAHRLKVIYGVGVACLENNIPLCPNDTLKDNRTNCFVSNGWSHFLGFDCERGLYSIKMRNGFAIVGGGACAYNLRVNLEGEITELSGKTIEDKVYVLDRFVKEFDAFEENFYAYVDKTIGKA